ncbi:translation initiation factor IF-2B subunit delta [Methanoculleus taiwanensis]|uniref:Ribose 1,5-bisphosphate isomerase n=1 Tax=Methanoculleus taiwanensis TaxID=1550565 RepID=A0A498GZ91_9EURY|nr:ribose 1,5-bisphosphate isomerase [Methanoculleus taiwanensis]RXE55698.1 translation initiation factor IF-2B subunit delta [Methanoculleus taiwanensis]
MLLTETAEDIRTMKIRGAGRIARAAAEALREYAGTIEVSDLAAFRTEMQEAAEQLIATRPTAVSLPNAVHAVMSGLSGADSLPEARSALRERADTFIRSSLHAVEEIAAIGARHISDGDVLMTHCNSEAALACILEADRQGKEIEVYATEVRPRNQGLVTIRTLNDAGIRTNYILDSAVRYFMNEVDLVIVGADAITVNGAVVNKIGTAQIALAAHEARTNLIVAAETYKFAPRTILGELIEIEERSGSEVLPDTLARALSHVRVRNPAFDVTPAEYVDLIVTEKGAIPPGLAYSIIKEYLGWSIGEFHKGLVMNSENHE